MNTEQSTIGLLGIAKKAGLLVSGEFAVEQAIRNRTAKLVLIAQDASDNTKKHFSDMCAYRSIPLIMIGDKATLGRMLGKELRASLALTDEKMAASLMKKMS